MVGGEEEGVRKTMQLLAASDGGVASTGSGTTEEARRGSQERDHKRDVGVGGEGTIVSFGKFVMECFPDFFLTFWMLFS